jgi:Fe-S cluster assembly ATPase SufC
MGQAGQENQHWHIPVGHQLTGYQRGEMVQRSNILNLTADERSGMGLFSLFNTPVHSGDGSQF